MKRRGAGILLHITSLPSPYGVGDLGPEAYRFVDFLAVSKQSYWQILPLSPVDPALGNSPYSSASSFAMSELLISPDNLLENGWIGEDDLKPLPDFPSGYLDFEGASEYKRRVLDIACRNLEQARDKSEFDHFCAQNAHWLDDHALFMSLKSHYGDMVWNQWPPDVRDREPGRINSLKQEFASAIFRHKAVQYFLFQQWSALKKYCVEKQIRIMGDLPIYVTYDSVDVWSNPHLFKLNAEKVPEFVAGVPPDYFSRTGQLWGNPVYNWEVLKSTGYKWWLQRLRHTFALVDLVRIDHFRGLVAFWEVNSGEKTALNGKWVEAPADDFLDTLLRHFPNLPLVAEDLGMITADVREIVKAYGLPGMKVLQFAFSNDDPMHPYLPHTYDRNSVVYTGTHDNTTARGWFEHEASADEKKRLFRYLGRTVTADEVSWELIRLAFRSVSNLAIVPMQDLLGLGREARMNKPSTPNGNWRWRLLSDQFTDDLTQRLTEITTTYGRA